MLTHTNQAGEITALLYIASFDDFATSVYKHTRTSTNIASEQTMAPRLHNKILHVF